MGYISKHVIADDHNRLILKKDEWEPLAWTAFLAIFGLVDAETIAVSEYKLEAWEKKEV